MLLPDEIPSELLIRGAESSEITVEAFANFMRDLVFLHDRIWLISSEEYRNRSIKGTWFYSRYGRSIPESQQLRLAFVRKESPFELGIVLRTAAIAAPVAWIYFQLLRGALLFPGEIKNQQLQNTKLEYEIAEKKDAVASRARQAIAAVQDDLSEFVRSSEEPADERLHLVERDVERLSESEVIVTDIVVRHYVRTKQIK